MRNPRYFDDEFEIDRTDRGYFSQSGKEIPMGSLENIVWDGIAGADDSLILSAKWKDTGAELTDDEIGMIAILQPTPTSGLQLAQWAQNDMAQVVENFNSLRRDPVLALGWFISAVVMAYIFAAPFISGGY